MLVRILCVVSDNYANFSDFRSFFRKIHEEHGHMVLFESFSKERYAFLESIDLTRIAKEHRV